MIIKKQISIHSYYFLQQHVSEQTEEETLSQKESW